MFDVIVGRTLITGSIKKMFKHLLVIVIGAVTLTGCASNPVGSANTVSAVQAGQVMRLSHGTIAGVRDVTIQGDSGNNVAGTVSGAVLGGVTGNAIGGGSGRRLATVGGAIAGGAAGGAIQRGMASTAAVELTVNPDDGSAFIVVQPAGESQFFIGQRVNISSQGNSVTISPAPHL